MNKFCTICGKEKPLTEFYFRRTEQKYRSDCISCDKLAKARFRSKPKVVPSEKRCRKCNILKPCNDFYQNPSSSDGLRPRCKECHNDDNARFGRSTRYGMTDMEFEALLFKQNHVCAICKSPLHFFKDIKSRKGCLNVDHCHVTGRVRGILCQPCNLGLGAFRDDPQLLQAAMNYLGSV